MFPNKCLPGFLNSPRVPKLSLHQTFSLGGAEFAFLVLSLCFFLDKRRKLTRLSGLGLICVSGVLPRDGAVGRRAAILQTGRDAARRSQSFARFGELHCAAEDSSPIHAMSNLSPRTGLSPQFLGKQRKNKRVEQRGTSFWLHIAPTKKKRFATKSRKSIKGAFTPTRTHTCTGDGQ